MKAFKNVVGWIAACLLCITLGCAGEKSYEGEPDTFDGTELEELEGSAEETIE